MEVKEFKLIEFDSGINYLGTCYNGSKISKNSQLEPCGIGSIYLPPDKSDPEGPAYIYHGEILAKLPNGIGLVASLD